jgi:ubiquinone biosynthesis protein UbiJ
LEAYSTIVVQAASEVDGDLGAARAIKAIVAGHASELASMLSMVSGPARAQLEATIVDSTRFLYRIDPAL